MYRWTPFPFLRITFSFVLGIFLAGFANFYFDEFQISLGIPATIIFAFFFTTVFFFRQDKASTLVGHLLLICIALAGFLSGSLYSEKSQKSSLNSSFSKSKAYTALVISYPIQKNQYFVYEIESNQYLSDSGVAPTRAKILLYEKRKNLKEATLDYGDKILIKGNPFLITPPKNPHEFNYSEYMADQNVFFQHFPHSKDVSIIASNKGNPFLSSVYRIRKSFENTIKSNIKSKDEQAVALALLLGIKDFLDPEIKRAFSAAGAMHVLAVSGLHVGVISMMLLWFFKLFKQPIIKKYLFPIISLVVLWFYAMLTGFSPSIFRAVTMFSVIIIGKSLQRSPNIYNSLAVSAFILLIINPNYLFAVGFQLSYLAVIGIVYFHDKFYKLWEPKSWLLDKTWTLICVSVAAQIATAPISIYYFHQFPTYFIFSNLIVIPISFLIMVLGVTMLVLKDLPWIDIVGHTLEKVIWFLNLCVEFIFHQKWSVQEWLFLSFNQTALIYLGIILFCSFLYFRRIMFLWSVCFVLMLISLEGSSSLIKQSLKKELVLYSTRETQIIDMISGLHTQLYALDSIKNMALIKYQIEPNRLSSHLPPVQNADLLKSKDRMISDFACLNVYDQVKYLHVFKTPPLENIKFSLNTDYLIVSNDSFENFEKIEDYIQLKCLIIDQSNSWKTMKNLQKQSKKKGIPTLLLNERAVIISRN